MNSAPLIPLIAAIVNLTLALFVFSRDVRARLNQVYLLLGLEVTVWNTGTFFMFQVRSEADAIFWARFLQFGVIFLPATFMHITSLMTKTQMPRTILFSYLLQGLLAVTNFTPFFIQGVRDLGYAFYAVAGPGFWIFVLSYLVSMSCSMKLLYAEQLNLAPLYRLRVKFLIVAYSILFVFGLNDVLPILGFSHYPIIHTRIFPFGSLAAIFFGIIVGYSVLQHRLLNIQVTLSRFAAQIMRLIFVFLLGISLLLIVSLGAPANQFPPFAFLGAIGVLMISVLVASLFFPRLFGKGDDFLERRILGDHFEYHDRVEAFIRSTRWYTDINLLIDDLHHLLVETIKVGHYHLILMDESSRACSLRKAFPEQLRPELVNWHCRSPIFQFFSQSRSEFLACNLADASPSESPIEVAAREQLDGFCAEIAFPLRHGDNVLGLLLVGAKLSGEPHTVHDLDLLVSLAGNFSLALYQIRLKDQLLAVEEMELLGSMSRGMAHDLNNLLTPVWTYLQLARELPQDKDGLAELLPNVLRNVQTIQAYIKEALFLSQNHKPQIRPGQLNLLIQKTVELADARLQRKNVAAQIQPLAETIIEMDDVLMQRMIGNLLANAIDASPAGGVVRIALDRLPRNDASRDWFRLRIMDQGEGISPENLKRIATPYFTTKDRGDEGRGFGLGLAICRNIVRLHGGKLSIASEEKKGTTVQVDLPSRQINHNNQEPSIVTAKP